MIRYEFETSIGSAHSRTAYIPEAGTYLLTVLRDDDDIVVALEPAAEHAARQSALRASMFGESS